MWLADLQAAYPGRFVTEILAEWERLQGSQYPEGLLGHVLEAGAYRQQKQMYDAADTPEAQERLPEGVADLVHEMYEATVEEDSSG